MEIKQICSRCGESYDVYKKHKCDFRTLYGNKPKHSAHFAPEPPKLFSARIKSTMRKQHIFSYQIADALGLNYTTVRGYVRGDRTPPISFLYDVCGILGVSSDYLLGIDGKTK